MIEDFQLKDNYKDLLIIAAPIMTTIIGFLIGVILKIYTKSNDEYRKQVDLNFLDIKKELLEIKILLAYFQAKNDDFRELKKNRVGNYS